MTQNNVWTVGNDENWKVRALNILWLEAHRSMHAINLRGRTVEAEGLHVYDVSAFLRKVKVDWTQYATPETRNMQDWLTHHFPVCMQPRKVDGETCVAVVFQYISKADYAACVLQERIPSLPVEMREYHEVLRMMRREYGLDEAAVDTAFKMYPKSLQRTEDGCAVLPAKVVVEMPVEVRECALNELKALIEAAPDRTVMATKVPTTIPWIKNYYGKGGLSVWLTENFEALKVEEKPDNPLIKVVRFKADTVQTTDTSWKARALNVLWEEAHLPLHPVTMRGKTVEIEGANVFDVGDLLRKNKIEWSSYRTPETTNITDWLTKNFPVCLQPKKVDGMTYTAIYFQYVSKVDYAACVLYDRLRQAPEKYETLVRQMEQEYGIGADTVAEAFGMYPQSFLRDGQQCQATTFKVVVDMPRPIQSCTYDVLKKAIDNDPEYCLLQSKVPGVAPWIKHYYTSLGSWLSNNFSFRTDQNVLRYASDMKDWCRNVVRDQLLKFRGQSARIEELDSLARNAKCDLTIIKGQRSRGEWLEELMQGTDIRLTEDGESVYIPLPEGQLELMPVRPHEEGEEELQQAQSMCYFSWEQIRQMAHLTGKAGQDILKAPWTRYFSHTLAQALSGAEGELLSDTQNNPPRLVLPMRLFTEEGAQLYAVLEKNPNLQKQIWQLAAIVYPGQEHENGCGRYLCERFGLATGSATQISYESLKEKLDQLQELQARLSDGLTDAARMVAAGLAGMPEGFIENIQLWEKYWSETDEIITSLGWKYDLKNPSIEDVRERVMDSSVESQMMDDAISQFDRMVSLIDRFMEENPPFNGAAYEPCRRQMEEDRKTVALSSFRSEKDCATFREILEDYHALREIAGAMSLTEELPQHQMVVSAHFGVPFFMTSQFMGTACRQFMSEPPLGCLDELDDLKNALDNISLSIKNRSGAVPKPRKAASAEELLEQLKEQGGEQKLYDVESIFPEDELEALIVRGELDQALALIQSKTSGTDMDKMTAGIERARKFGASLNLVSIAKRLMAVVGNRNRSAEKYLLSSCLQCGRGNAEARQMLLDIYREENRADAFSALVFAEDVRHDLKNQRYYLRSLCGGDYSAMLEYLKEHVHLMYDEECLKSVRRAAEEAGDGRLLERLEGFSAPPDRESIHDQAAQAVIAGNMNPTDVLDGAQLAGYGEDELRQLRKALPDADSMPTGGDDASIGIRLYRCFGNRDRMAERYLWDALASDERQIYADAATHLVVILSAETRWNECRYVYERYETECAAVDESRLAYLASLLNTDPGSAIDGIRENLHDVLTLYAESSSMQAQIAALKDHDDPKISEFYTKVEGLCRHLGKEFPRSVILLGRNLRELLAQPEKVREIGFTEAEEERMKLLRRTNDYPGGMDPVSIAERVYRFMGCRDGVAEAYASFAMPKNEAAELLARIYRELHEERELVELMKAQPALRAAHWEEYCRLLFDQNEEELLREAFETRSPDTVNQRVIAQILSIRTEGVVTADFTLCVEELLQADIELSAALFGALADRNMIDGLYALASANIVRMLNEWSLENILDMLSGCGRISEDQLERLQQMALENECYQLAVLLWSRMGVGDLQTMADQMYDRMTQDIAGMNVDEQMKSLACLQKLFTDKGSHLAIQSLVLEIGQLEEKGEIEAAAAMIGEKLKNIQLNGTMLGSLLQTMSARLCAHELVCAYMEQLAEQDELLRACLARYHCVAQEAGEAFENEGFAGYMARLYLRALHAGVMPEDMITGAERLCCEYVQAYHMEAAMLCLVYLERMLGREAWADYVLHALASAQADGGEPDEELQSLLNERWSDEIPSAIKLFRTTLLSCNAEQIQAYCEFAGHFVDRDMSIPQFGSGAGGDELLSDAECALLLNSLYARPDDLERWAACADRLPMQGAPAAKARLRLLCCQKGGIQETAEWSRETSSWWKCAELCFACELDDLLLETLMGWSAQGEEQLERTRRPVFLLRCRDFVEERVVEDGEFLNRWREAHAEELRTLLRRFFRLITDDEANLQKTSIIVTSVLTVALRDQVILMEFIEKKQSILLNDQPDLGFALFCRLMLVGRFEEAKLVLDALEPCMGRCTYRVLLEQLKRMDVEALQSWNEQYGNNSLLRLALPGGSMPPLEVMNDWTMDCIHTFRQEEGLDLSNWLCTIFPNNKPFSRMRFFMLKNSGFDRLKEIHHTLYQIISNTPRGETDRFDIRSTQDYACLLAGVNAVLMDTGDTQGIDYYDFGVSAGDFYRSCVMDSSDAVQRINLCQTRFADALQNRPEESRQKIRRVIVSWVTGDWLGVLHDSWENPDEWADAWLLSLPVVSHGFARSAMRFLLTLEENERQSAEEWLKTLSSDDRHMQIAALDLCRRHLSRIGDQETAVIRMKDILNYPLEESGMAIQMLNSILNPDLLSDMNSAKRYATAVLALMANRTSVIAANNIAFSSFQAHEDRKASALYYALARCAEKLRLTHIPTLVDPTRINSMALRYKRYRYLIIMLSDDPQLQSDDLKNDVRGNYFNLTLQLVSSERADEALLLRRRLPVERREIVDAVLYLISNRSDADKMEYARTLADEYVRKGVYFLMSRWGRDLPHSYYVRSQSTVIECNRIYNQMLRVESEFIDWMGLRPNAAKASRQIQPPQEDPKADVVVLNDDETAAEENGEAMLEQTEEVLGDINKQLNLTPLTEEEDPADPEELQRIYEGVENLTQEDRLRRAALSERMYRMALAGRGRLSRVDGLVRFAVDNFMVGSDREEERCLLVLQTASVVRYAGEKNRSNFRNMVNRSALLALLRRSHPSLRELLGEFYRYRINYNMLMDMISDEEAVKVIHAVYKVLDMLYGTYEKLSLSDIEPLKAALTEARTILSRQPYKRNWGDITGPLMNMILVEFNLLDEQPRLVLRVLNEGACRRIGKIFGQVENIGRSEARDIQLWISFGDGKVSAPHRLSSLPAGGKAVFDIGYQAERGVESLSYRVDAICFSRSGSRLQAEAESGEIAITMEELPFFATTDMNTATITVFRPNEQNTDVVSPDFFGRESEKRRLRSLYDDKSFENCRNAVVYGIRRSGKTSLLNYISAYLNHTRDDLVAVVVSGQGASTVYGVFIRDVLSRLKGYVEDDGEMDSYQSLEDRWKRPEDAADIDPAELMFFYNDVKRYLGGRGLVVIVDEFDRLLEKLDTRQDLESSFYPVLSSMLCDAVCAQTVHFLFCGSKELIIEKNKDRQITQIFQRMGETDIAIGAMPKQEMIALVTKPFSRYECVKFTEAALEWLWSMAGGLVWFSKLIAKEALTRAGEDERSVVYPSDVFKAACTVSVNDGYCKQFYEGFREDERTVVEAMGNLALRPEQYVTMGQIMELLQSRMTRERADRAMRNLIDLEMVESSRQNASLYRFRVDIYRRYFRAQTEYPRVLPVSEGQDVNFQIVLN